MFDDKLIDQELFFRKSRKSSHSDLGSSMITCYQLSQFLYEFARIRTELNMKFFLIRHVFAIAIVLRSYIYLSCHPSCVNRFMKKSRLSNHLSNRSQKWLYNKLRLIRTDVPTLLTGSLLRTSYFTFSVLMSQTKNAMRKHVGATVSWRWQAHVDKSVLLNFLIFTAKR